MKYRNKCVMIAPSRQEEQITEGLESHVFMGPLTYEGFKGLV